MNATRDFGGSPGSRSSQEWSHLKLVCDPGVGKQITTVHPVLSVAFYTRVPNYLAIGNLYHAAMALVKPQLTHYQAEDMDRPVGITPRALGMIPAWLRKPKKGHRYWWDANGGADLGCAPPGFSLSMMAYPPPTPEEIARTPTFLQSFYGVGDVLTYYESSAFRITLPVDHLLSDGPAMLQWLLSLELLQSGDFAFGECGYGLDSLAGAFGYETEGRERAACSRYPGLDCFRHAHINCMFRVDPAYPDVIPLVKRAAWTTILHEVTVQYLGGETKIRAQLDDPEIRLVPLQHGLIIQAGPRPQLGDLNRGDFLPLLRKVAKVLRPARVEKLAQKGGEFWEHFFTIFDKDYT